jgi:hypothetical protein
MITGVFRRRNIKSCAEGHHHNSQQKDHIDPKHFPGIVHHKSKHAVVNGPVEANDQEGNQESDKFWDQVAQCFLQPLIGQSLLWQFRHPDLDHEQGNGDGKNSITEKNQSFQLKFFFQLTVQLITHGVVLDFRLRQLPFDGPRGNKNALVYGYKNNCSVKLQHLKKMFRNSLFP